MCRAFDLFEILTRSAATKKNGTPGEVCQRGDTFETISIMGRLTQAHTDELYPFADKWSFRRYLRSEGSPGTAKPMPAMAPSACWIKFGSKVNSARKIAPDITARSNFVKIVAEYPGGEFIGRAFLLGMRRL